MKATTMRTLYKTGFDFKIHLKGRELNFDDIFHYQKIIVALTETDRIMKEIDKVIQF